MPRVSPVARITRRSNVRVESLTTSSWTAAGTTGSCTSRPARTSRSTNTSALSGPGSSHADPSSQNDPGDVAGNVNEPSTSRRGSRSGMNVPWLNWMPKNSASVGTGAVVARVSGPRTVSHAPSSCRVTTISQWHTATDRKDSSDRLRVLHVVSTRGVLDDHRSNANSSTARFMTDYDGATHRNSSDHLTIDPGRHAGARPPNACDVGLRRA